MSRTCHDWTDEERSWVMAHKDTMSISAMAEHIGVSVMSIRGCLMHMMENRRPLTRWSKEEVEFLKANVHMSVKELAAALNRNYYSVLSKLNNLEIYQRRITPYTEEECAFIERNAATMPVKDIAKRLGRTPQAISNYCYNRRIRTAITTKRERYDDIYIDVLRMVAEGLTMREMQESLGMTRGQLGKYLSTRNISIRELQKA